MKGPFYTKVAEHKKISLKLASKLIHQKKNKIQIQNPHNDRVSNIRSAVEFLCS